ncbi:MAG: hypothetical protein KDK45_18290, partial [Leptospiraceae bacterium]|nr:hypothetical protein [Leptospiraceae bacterium]
KWNALKNIPDWISGINSTTFTSISMGTVFKSIAENYSSDRISQYTTMFDGNQRYFYNVMLTIDSGKAYEDTKAMWGSSEGINVPDSISCDWKSKMLSNINTANAAISDNYRYYIAPGDVHTITTDDTMFTVSSGTNNSVKFTDWLNAMLTDSSDWVNTKCSSCNPPASTENKLSALCP